MNRFAMGLDAARAGTVSTLQPHAPKVTGDKVGPHGDLIAEFPYLGPPHSSR
jgi:hypothetical protein